MRVVWLVAAMSLAATACVLLFLPLFEEAPAARLPKAGDRIVAESVFAPEWTAGKLNDALLRYRFADAESSASALSGSAVPHDQLPQIRIEYFRNGESIAVEEAIAWCTRFC